jgi:hypothetical protein
VIKKPQSSTNVRIGAPWQVAVAFQVRRKILGFDGFNRGAVKAMRPKFVFVAALAASFICVGHAALAGNIMFGPGPGLTGNDTGGIIMYAPGLYRGAYHQMAANWCARWGRLSHLTSMHQHYGDYIGFVCIDRPWMFH